MGLFDKVKSGLKGITDRVTGGYGEATLTLEEGPIAPGESVKGKLHIKAMAALKVDAIILTIEGWENSEYDAKRRHEDAHERAARDKHQTVNVEKKLEEAFELAEGEHRDIDVEIELPSDVEMTYKGKTFTHTYKLSAQVDVPWGVDLRTETEFVVLDRIPEHPGKLTLEYSCGKFSGTLSVDSCIETGGVLNWSVEWESTNGTKHKYPPFCERVTMEEQVFCTLYEPEGEGERLTGQEWSTVDNPIHFHQTFNSNHPSRKSEMKEDGTGGTMVGSFELERLQAHSYGSNNFKNEFVFYLIPFEDDEDGNEKSSEPLVVKVFPKPS